MNQKIKNLKRAETLRMFFAVRVPENLHQPLIDFQKKIRGDWRLVNPAQFHITLVFMPFVLESEISIVENAGKKAAETISKFRVRLGRVGGFPDNRRPRVFVIHAESQELGKLAETIRKNLQNVDHDSKPFKGHLTLARARNQGTPISETSFDLEWEVSELELIHSILEGKGPDHRLFRAFSLKA